MALPPWEVLSTQSLAKTAVRRNMDAELLVKNSILDDFADWKKCFKSSE